MEGKHLGENERADIFLLTHAILKDNQLSLKAKGLYFNMIFLIKEQDLTMSMIKGMGQADSDRSIKMGLTELEKGGYIIRKALQNGDVIWDLNRTMNIINEKVATVKTVEEKKKHQTNKPIRKKVQANKNTRTHKTKKRTGGLNHALRKIFEEFF